MRKPVKGILENSALIWKVLILVTLMIVLTFLAMGIWALSFHGSQSITSLKVMQMLQTVFTFCLPCLIGAWLWSKTPITWLRLNKGVGWKPAVIVVALMICGIPFINMLAWLNEQLTLPSFLADLESLMKSQEEAAQELTERFIRADNIGVLFYNLFLMALLPAFSEEICFRGTLQQLFYIQSSDDGNTTQPVKYHLAIWVSAIIFSAIHFQFYGFVPRMLMGALFGYLLVWSGSLWLPVLAHFTNNAMSVILYNVFYMNGKNVEEVDALGTGSTLWLGLLSMLVVTGLIWLLHHLYAKRKEISVI